MAKYYAVAWGRIPGIYTCWEGPEGAKAQIMRFKGSLYKSFLTEKEAQDWYENQIDILIREDEISTLSGDSDSYSEKLNHLKDLGYTELRCAGWAPNYPGLGGWGVQIVNPFRDDVYFGGFSRTTQIRMQLFAIPQALQKKRNN